MNETYIMTYLQIQNLISKQSIKQTQMKSRPRHRPFILAQRWKYHTIWDALFTLFSYKAISSSWFQRICISQINHFSNYKFHIICFWVGPQVFLMHERNKFSKNKVPGKLLPYSLYNIYFLVWNGKVYLICNVRLSSNTLDMGFLKIIDGTKSTA